MIRSFMVTPVLNGYIVEIGCQRLVFESVEKLTTNIALYLNNPDEVEKAFLDGSLNSRHRNSQEPAQPTPVLRNPYGVPAGIGGDCGQAEAVAEARLNPARY